jgi:phospholipid/cholesterol/gamma-HCH transport system substrate-binding protein
MATKTQKVKVGIFMVSGLALIVAIFVMVTIKNREPMDTYYITFIESVSGLGKDCAVLYRGVPVGTVREVRVSDKNEVIASVGIATRRVTLRQGTVATLAMSNLMGGMQVELSGGDPGAPPLDPGSTIPSRTSIMENVTQDLPKILENIQTILVKLDRSIGEVNTDRIGSLLRNSDEAIVTANTTLEEITAFLKTTRGTILNTEYEITRTMRNLNEAIMQATRAFSRLNEEPSSVFWGRRAPHEPHAR